MRGPTPALQAELDQHADKLKQIEAEFSAAVLPRQIEYRRVDLPALIDERDRRHSSTLAVLQGLMNLAESGQALCTQLQQGWAAECRKLRDQLREEQESVRVELEKLFSQLSPTQIDVKLNQTAKVVELTAKVAGAASLVSSADSVRGVIQRASEGVAVELQSFCDWIRK